MNILLEVIKFALMISYNYQGKYKRDTLSTQVLVQAFKIIK